MQHRVPTDPAQPDRPHRPGRTDRTGRSDRPSRSKPARSGSPPRREPSARWRVLAGWRCRGSAAPPRIEGVERSVRRRPDGGATVAIRLRGRPWAAVLGDMVEGVVVANRPHRQRCPPGPHRAVVRCRARRVARCLSGCLLGCRLVDQSTIQSLALIATAGRAGAGDRRPAPPVPHPLGRHRDRVGHPHRSTGAGLGRGR